MALDLGNIAVTAIVGLGSAAVVLACFRARHLLGLAPLATLLGGLQILGLHLADRTLPVAGALAVSPVSGILVSCTLLALLVTHVREGTHRARELLVGLIATTVAVGALGALLGDGPALPMLLAATGRGLLLFSDALLLLLSYEIVGRAVRPLFVRVAASLALALHAHAMVATTVERLGDPTWFGHLVAALAGATVGAAIVVPVGTVYLRWFEDRAFTGIRRDRPLDDVLPILTLRRRFGALRTDAMRDRDSGLYTRVFFEDALVVELDRAQQLGRHAALVLLEIEPTAPADEVGRALLEALRVTDLPCRYEGPRYAAVMPGADARAARASADRVAKRLAGGALGSGARPITVRVGVACYPDDGDRPEELVRVATRRLDRACARPAQSTRAG